MEVSSAPSHMDFFLSKKVMFFPIHFDAEHLFKAYNMENIRIW